MAAGEPMDVKSGGNSMEVKGNAAGAAAAAAGSMLAVQPSPRRSFMRPLYAMQAPRQEEASTPLGSFTRLSEEDRERRSFGERFTQTFPQFMVEWWMGDAMPGSCETDPTVYYCETACDAVHRARVKRGRKHKDGLDGVAAIHVYRLFFDSKTCANGADVWDRLFGHNINDCIEQRRDCKVNHEEEQRYRRNNKWWFERQVRDPKMCVPTNIDGYVLFRSACRCGCMDVDDQVFWPASGIKQPPTTPTPTRHPASAPAPQINNQTRH
jgi:hypothetical protein